MNLLGYKWYIMVYGLTAVAVGFGLGIVVSNVQVINPMIGFFLIIASLLGSVFLWNKYIKKSIENFR